MLTMHKGLTLWLGLVESIPFQEPLPAAQVEAQRVHLGSTRGRRALSKCKKRTIPSHVGWYTM